jgi:2-amino-4-hydroxy-6-hydroxymethyldihydropteridine diphosphokinase
MAVVVLGLGSNLGNKELNILQTVELIKKNAILSDIVCSKLYITKALLPENAENAWDIDYINMALKGNCSLSAEMLLKRIKFIEKSIGRKKALRWAPRLIDIDILAYGDINVNRKNLLIPHKELLNRMFALQPFAEIMPDWRYPVKKSEFYGKTIIEIIKKVDDDE